jgi:signal transduction histidine kinase/ActR/RegA family two-component response regulator
MESENSERVPGRGFAEFRGIVADSDGEATPPEWERLSPETPLPVELLNGGKSVEQDLYRATDQMILGALVEMQRAVWVPVESRGHLRGVLLAGQRKKHAALPVRLLESVSAELALVVELDDERRRAQQQEADLLVTKQCLEQLANSGPTDAVLTRLLDSCTETGPEGHGLGATFAFLCARDEATGTSELGGEDKRIDKHIGVAETHADTGAEARHRCALSWQSGDPAWLRTFESHHLEDLWQRAREAHYTVTARSGAGTAWPRSDVSRLVAISLEAAGKSIGMLTAGFRSEPASRAAIERLESRAALATTALLLGKRNDEAARHRAREKGASQASGAAPEVLTAQGAASRLDRAEAQLLTVIEWLDEGVVLYNAEHDIQIMNSRFLQFVGFSMEETGRVTTLNGLITRLADQVAEPEKFARRWRDLASNLGAGARDEIQMLRPVPRVLERAARPVLDPDGRLIGRVEIYRDLTAQRLSQSKLLHTERLAALGQTVTGVAHELSNPLTSILGYAQRLFLRSQAEGKSDEVRQIFQEADRASMIVRRLLMSARESRPERRKVALNLLVLSTMDLQKIRLAAEKVDVALDLDEALPFVLGDAGQLQQVLMNLIGNARQAIAQRGNGGTIRLSTKCIDSGRRAQLEVSDDGPGIPPEIASRIFDPFFTTKPAGIGTGLGLAIVQGVVREHSGRVMVASPPGGGAIFTLDFPATPAEHTRMPAVPATGPGELDGEVVPAGQAPALPQRATPAAAPALASWKGTRVLVVEDEPTVARLISDVLQDEGLQVEALLDGYEALEQAARASYDLVICDMKMPGLDGQHFYETLACMGNPLSKRFLFVTGDVLSSHTQEFLERHHLPHVAKPFRVEELTEKVRRVLAEIRPDEPCSAPAARTNAASI